MRIRVDKNNELDSIRIDKWLWAARFYKTRMLATEAVNGGKVHINGVRFKAGKRILIDYNINIKKGDVSYSIIVLKIINQRRPAKEAILAYQETEQSIAERTEKKQKKQDNFITEKGKGRPSKKARRQFEKVSGKFDLT